MVEVYMFSGIFLELIFSMVTVDVNVTSIFNVKTAIAIDFEYFLLNSTSLYNHFDILDID